MKLAEYSIQEAMNNQNWDAAMRILVNYFKLDLSSDPKIDIVVDPHTLCEISISGEGKTYTWCEGYGFSVWPIGVPGHSYNTVNIYTNG